MKWGAVLPLGSGELVYGLPYPLSELYCGRLLPVNPLLEKSR